MSRRRLLALLLLAVPASAQLFRPVASLPLGASTYYAIADFNIDGRLDFARAAAFTGRLTVFLGNGNGGFSSAPTGTMDIDTPTGLVTGDFDHDGKPDLVVLSSTLFSEPTARVLLGAGNGSFTSRGASFVADLIRAAAPGDFDEDGSLDLAIVTSNAGGTLLLSVLRGNGRGDLVAAPLTAPVTVPVTLHSIIGTIKAADLNADRHLDLVMTISNTVNVGLAVALGDGRGSFTATASTGNQAPGDSPLARLALADFNGDHALDVVMFGFLRDRVTLFTNSAGVMNQQISTTIAGSGPYGIAVADLDLDGRMDWAVGRSVPSGFPAELNIILGQGGINFTASQSNPFPFGGPTPLVEAADFNNDRRVDLLVGEGNLDSFLVLLNDVPRPPTMLAQEIVFPQPSDRGLNEGTVLLAGTATSGLPVAFAGITPLVCTVTKGVVTLLNTGVCTVSAVQTGDFYYSAAPIVTRSFNVSRNTQIITFAPLADRTLDASPFTVSATASSGLAVAFASSPATVCTVSGNLVTLVGPGQCSITASQPGNTTFPAAPPVTRSFTVTAVVPVGPIVESIANAASYALGALAPNSYAVIFGQRLSTPTVRLRDAAGTQHLLELIFSGPTQINFIVPGNVVNGPAAVTVTTAGGAAEFPVTISTTAPGLFSANGTGQGLAAAQALIVNTDRTITTLTVGDSPIPVRIGTEIYLVLYGTGIRGHSPTGVFASVGGLPAEVLYAGPQGTFPALDQVNLRVPLTVAFGTSQIRVIIDGAVANVVTALFQ